MSTDTRATAEHIAKDFADFPSTWGRKLADAIDKALRDERERCAKLEPHVYDEYQAQTVNPQAKKIASEVCRMYATAIRNKGETDASK